VVEYLPYLVEIGLLVFCLIDCLQSDEASVRNLSKGWWMVLIILLPVVGGIAWLVAGRPEQHHRRRDVAWPATQTSGFPEHERPRGLAPDDDPEFLAGLRASDAKHEQMLRDWEAQLRERERRLDERDDDPAT
jgi:hypothetical protein